MKVDERATKAARQRHARGMRVLDALFGFAPAKAPLNAMTGRAIPEKKAKRIYRAWRDETFPARVKRRRRRKLANETKRLQRKAARR